MVIDCLAPIIVPEGVGTIITLNNRHALTDGLRYVKIEVETFVPKRICCYFVGLKKVPHKSKNIHRKLYFTADAMVYTPNGWISVEEASKTPNVSIRILEYKCNFCDKWYISNKPFLGSCSDFCSASLFKKGLTTKPINQTSIENGRVREGWDVAEIESKTTLSNTEVVRVTKIENGNSLYVGGVLISLLSLTQPGIISK